MITIITSRRFPFRSLALIILIFFLVVSTFTTTTKADVYEIMKDSDGKNVVNGGKYKLSMVPLDGSQDTEVSVAEITRYPGSKLCWLAVIQSHEKGLPITIKNTLVKSNYVLTDFPVIVSFADDDDRIRNSNCTDTFKWVVVNRAYVDKNPPVMVGDNEGDEFGDAVKDTYFYVKPYPYHDAEKHEYMFRYCYNDVYDERCDGIGVLIDHENQNLKRLVSGDGTTLIFKFHKVTDDSKNSLILPDIVKEKPI